MNGTFGQGRATTSILRIALRMNGFGLQTTGGPRRKRSSASSSGPSTRNWPANWHSWPNMTRPRGPFRRSWTCPTGKSTFLSASACRTTAGSPRGSAWTASIFCRMKKSPGWNGLCGLPAHRPAERSRGGERARLSIGI
jgi:hypothetical protein